MYRAKETFWAPDNRRIVKGDLVSPEDDVVKGRETLFEAVVIPQVVQPGQTADEDTKGPETPHEDPATADDAGDDAGDGDTPPADDGRADAGDTAAAPAKTAAPAKKTAAARKTTAAKGGTTS